LAHIISDIEKKYQKDVLYLGKAYRDAEIELEMHQKYEHTSTKKLEREYGFPPVYAQQQRM
jgi:hypothetical protein